MQSNIKQLVKFSAHSVKGLRYEENEDALLVFAEHDLFAVADGMGGRNGGVVASNTIKDYFVSKLLDFSETLSADVISSLAREANSKIFQLSQENPELKGMGSTLSLLSFIGDKVFCVHVGDSRIYRLLNFQLELLSTDHTKDAFDLGQVSDYKKPQRGITRAMGVKPKVKLDFYTFEHIETAEYLLTTDGITDLVADFEIANILTNLEETYNKRVQRLVNLAIERGGSDDKSVIFLSGRI